MAHRLPAAVAVGSLAAVEAAACLHPAAAAAVAGAEEAQVRDMPACFTIHRLTLLLDAGAWRGSDQSSLITKAMARTPGALFPSNSTPASTSVAAAAAAKQAARISEITATMERFDTMLNKPSLKLPDGGANVRAAPLHACSHMC